MPAGDREAFAAWSESSEHRGLVAETVARMRRWRRTLHRRPLVTTSGGKDSTVALHLASSVWHKSELLAWHWDYGRHLVPRPYEGEAQEVVCSVASRTGVRVLFEGRHGGEEARDTPDDGHRQFFVALGGAVWANRCDCSLAGMRALESAGRKRRVSDYREYNGATGVWLLHPLADWSARDVWAHIVGHGLPHVSIYDELARLHGGYCQQGVRFVTFFDREFDFLGSSNVDGILSWRHRHVG